MLGRLPDPVYFERWRAAAAVSRRYSSSSIRRLIVLVRVGGSVMANP